ncbi:hypothetical protein [Ekhidna sp.]|uniref:hypothetical protein n=1 Tax=Ekhidna sp. TaxID=2608089 RepID=UPI003C7AB511
MFPKSIKQISLAGSVWGTALDEECECLYIECRNEEDRTIFIARLNLKNLELESRKVNITWWDKLVGVKLNQLYFVKYLDQNDPTQQLSFILDFESGVKAEWESSAEFSIHTRHPEIYEHGSDYFDIVSKFLALELPVSCEYLEWQNKIIISYYLRSANGFDRYLLLLKNGEKEWKVKQDQEMKGFSSGAFFVFDNQLIFIKDRNEVCVYTG